MNKIFNEVAKNNGTTAKEVKKEISLAIKEAMANPDPEVQAFWKQLAKDKKEPTPEELIACLVEKISKN